MSKVILDCDTGNDDAWSIISLLRAEEIVNFKVIAITCVNGNTTIEHSSLNTLLVLKTLNRLDVPVFKGAQSSLIRNDEHYEPFHGVDGFGMIYSECQKPSKDLVQKQHAVHAMKQLIDENSGDITLIAIGPLTNIALLYKLYPGISAKVSKLYVMGGNHKGIGNVSKCAEFNFWSDPEAAHIVFEESECEIYVFPWEPCLESAIPMDFHKWRIEVLSSNKNQFTELLDPIEIKAYSGKLEHWTPCDCFLVSTFISPNIIKEMKKHHVTVELSGNHTRGQMVIDHCKKLQPNAFVIESLHVDKFKSFIKWVCHHQTTTEFLVESN